MDALVTDAHIPSAVTGMRALGRAGLKVIALAPDRRAAGLRSRYAAARAVGPDAIDDPRGFVQAVAEEAERHGRVVVYPGQDEALNALLDAQADLPAAAHLPYAGPEPLAELRDKGRLSELAATAGLPTPTLLASGRADALLGVELPDGAVVKPVRPGGDFPEARVAMSRESLREILAAAPQDVELMLQERLSGRLMAVSVVVDRDGALVRRFQQVAVRTWPEDAGISSLAVSVEPDEDLVEACRSLLASAGHWGLAQLQFIDSVDGPRLIDVNTRFYGSLALALAAGVDLPSAWHAVALERPAGRPEPYRTGVVYRWLEADLMAAARGRPRHLFSRARRPRTGPMWAWDDPAASIVFAAGALAGPLARRLRRR
jgi:predicted ATP-grasp superfamily ATP-dependent carboligase